MKVRSDERAFLMAAFNSMPGEASYAVTPLHVLPPSLQQHDRIRNEPQPGSEFRAKSLVFAGKPSQYHDERLFCTTNRDGFCTPNRDPNLVRIVMKYVFPTLMPIHNMDDDCGYLDEVHPEELTLTPNFLALTASKTNDHSPNHVHAYLTLSQPQLPTPTKTFRLQFRGLPLTRTFKQNSNQVKS